MKLFIVLPVVMLLAACAASLPEVSSACHYQHEKFLEFANCTRASFSKNTSSTEGVYYNPYFAKLNLIEDFVRNNKASDAEAFQAEYMMRTELDAQFQQYDEQRRARWAATSAMLMQANAALQAATQPPPEPAPAFMPMVNCYSNSSGNQVWTKCH